MDNLERDALINHFNRCFRKCICESSNIVLNNVIVNNRDYKLGVINNSLILFDEDYNSLGRFEIQYCPKCGKKL